MGGGAHMRIHGYAASSKQHLRKRATATRRNPGRAAIAAQIADRKEVPHADIENQSLFQIHGHAAGRTRERRRAWRSGAALAGTACDTAI
jgi:hypothetical protein